ncbi:hypothetical protein BME48_12145, partial [Klebsiella pneumoniae]
LHGDVLMWLMKTLLTSGCTNQRGAGHFGSVNSSRRARSGSCLLPGISIYGKQISQARDIYY